MSAAVKSEGFARDMLYSTAYGHKLRVLAKLEADYSWTRLDPCVSHRRLSAFLSMDMRHYSQWAVGVERTVERNIQ
jgi:hypothetical protein